MPDRLIQHIRKSVSVTDEDVPAILSHFKTVNTAKKEILQHEDSLCRYHYFVLKGLLRMYYIDDKGAEKTTQFALENWWLTDHQAFMTQARSGFSIQAVEKSEILAISFASQEDLLKQFPQLERYFRLLYERAYAASQTRMRFFHDFSKEEAYLNFSTRFPAFLQRIPQYLLASYLGLTPEYLSEIRKKLS